ncbi:MULTISPECIES: helix-turn-helix domain-containing protein [Clostridium]|uniref:helix-turn-helix domain-containing protein n=1 Tax=Clostridium TaxID=1485 RepID=UPI000825EF51|nr:MULTISPECIES: helix-turn-helix transcriptional regulator [Clostridium]PJI10196.1 XRE family transcriptional regulator [Clostridium sp. CT7]
MRELRLKNNMTLDKLSKKINISVDTLMHVEEDKLNNPYYWRLICNYFGINHINYLKLYNMKEKCSKEKLLKLKAYMGAKSWKSVSISLGYSKDYISEILRKNKIPDTVYAVIQQKLSEIKRETF